MQILGQPSHDVDIALNDIMGQDFAEKVQVYLQAVGRGDAARGMGTHVFIHASMRMSRKHVYTHVQVLSRRIQISQSTSKPPR